MQTVVSGRMEDRVTEQARQTQTGPRLERRRVEVHEPGVSPKTNERLTHELREVLGAESAMVPADRPHPSTGEPLERKRAVLLPWRPNNFLLVQVAASGVVGGAILALITNTWWVLPAVVAVLVGATWVVVAIVMAMTANSERPSPATVAALDEEGIHDPEGLFSDLVAEYTEDPGARGQNKRTANVEDDPVRAAAEHETSITASGGSTRPIGNPGRRN